MHVPWKCSKGVMPLLTNDVPLNQMVHDTPASENALGLDSSSGNGRDEDCKSAMKLHLSDGSKCKFSWSIPRGVEVSSVGSGCADKVAGSLGTDSEHLREA